MLVLTLVWGLQSHTDAGHQGWFAAVCQEDQAGVIPSADGAGHPGEAGTVPDSQGILLLKHMVHQMGQLIVAEGLHLGVVLRISTPSRSSALLCQVQLQGVQHLSVRWEVQELWRLHAHRQDEGNSGICCAEE